MLSKKSDETISRFRVFSYECSEGQIQFCYKYLLIDGIE